MRGPHPLAGGVHAAVASVEETLREATPTPRETHRARRLPSRRAREHLAGRVLLRRTLTAMDIGARPDEPIGGAPGTRPHLPRLPDVGVSVAHTEDLVAVAVAPGQAVGIDIESPRPVSRALLRRCCTPTMLGALDHLADEPRWATFAGVWTVHEACVKALGTGFAGRPKRVPVSPGSRTGQWNQCRWWMFPDRWPVPAACAVVGPS
jgi:4'-phosphopantetheinyl transferase